MENNYSYLRTGGIKEGAESNWFAALAQIDISSCEEVLGFSLPSQLRDFYSMMGVGMIRSPHNPTEGYKFYGLNEILHPKHMVELYLGEDIEWPTSVSQYYRHPSAEFPPGELPFFEIADGSQFLIMKPLSDNPNAVYTESGILIEDSFERFIWRLYYEDPGYYCNIINCDLYKSIFKDSLKSLSPEGAAEELKEFVIRGPFPYEDIQDSVKDREKLIQRLHEEVFEEIKNAPPPPLSRSTDVYDDTNPEDHLMAWWQKDQQEALRQFTMILARDALVKRLEKGLDKIPLQVLKELMEKLLTKSDFHKATCLTLLRKRQEMTR
jgi:hypothetical protein